ncbi:TIGR02444 family protein [Alteromonas sp. CYL-A6]|uniref:TIGR02444 family protein n=1 Tax=Alteromonas nitratireducens TaxID=3390813 RepID=UPI0034BC4A65
MSKVDLSAAAFWDYSVSVYTRSDVAAHALSLQDNHGVNVNLLLLLCWCLENGVVLNLKQFSDLRAAIADSESALQQHRVQRRQAHPDNGGNQADYEVLKAQELVLEREQQAQLVSALEQLDKVVIPSASSGGIMNASVAAFIHSYQIRDSEAARRHLSVIVSLL